MNNIVAGEKEFKKEEIAPDNSHATEVENVNISDRDLGKFSSSTELKNAYDSLQAEFTRRSQRLKELEREIEKLKTSEQPKTASQEKDFLGESGFFKSNPEAEEIKSLLYDIATKSEDKAQGFLERAYVSHLKNQLKTAGEKYSSKEYIYEKALENASVKTDIIKEYLGSVYASKPTARLISGNGGAIISPPSKPTNLYEANLIAKSILEKAKEIN